MRSAGGTEATGRRTVGDGFPPVPGRRAKAAIAVAVSALVHLMTGALMVAGVLLIVLGWETIVQPGLGLLLI